ncbi:unnamed protein product (macronuclear) [Paramecium tetraurelia]|uniref:Uncharacterized protein n=1 Tax=Paramecium tetraurelia TaxID=5888 RepID=A0BID6_PARTE|nr:uncharacterized protein GSPATT00004675001 [Paramecium tetraurelia]CAK58303.1 unnamed protein product [Paramecium tetraurelia]|eukprot:XP_001425701.1 hypothetical protein (macronuclear) [Paramecium tetraurelia strain d4-2]
MLLFNPPPTKIREFLLIQLNTKTLSQNCDVLKPHNSQELVESQNELKSHYETCKYEYQKTYAGNVQSDSNKDTASERRSNTLRKDGTAQESKENYGFSTKTSITDYHITVGNSRLQSQNNVFLQQKPKISIEISKISGQLRDLMSSVQRFVTDGRLPDNINDKMIDILATFRKVEELSIADPNENDSKTLNMAEDYNKLKAILEQLQSKMTALVQENQKLNKNLVEKERRKREQAEDKSNQTNKEFNRVFECLQINQEENEELKMKLQQADSFKGAKTHQNKINNNEIQDYKLQNIQLQKELDVLESKYKQLLSEKATQKFIPKCPLILKSIHSSTSNQSEQLELKLLQLQIENDNLKAQMAHNQVDSKAIDNKNEMIQRLDDKIKSLLKEKAISEEQSVQVCNNLESQMNIKDKEVVILQKQRNEVERESKGEINSYIQQLKVLEDKLQTSKQENQNLFDEFKPMDIRKNKVQEELKMKQKKPEQLSQELQFQKQESKKVMDKRQTLQQKCDQMNQQLQQQTSIQQQLLQQIDGLKQTENAFKLECDRLNNMYKATKQEMKYQVTELNEMIQLQGRRTQEKERQLNELIEEMGDMKDQYEVQKKVCQEIINDLERKNSKLQNEEFLQIKEQEIIGFKLIMEQQLKMLDKRNALSSYDFDQREQQLQVEIQSKNEQINDLKLEIEKIRSHNFNTQEELLRNGILQNQNQAIITNLKNELNQSKQEQQDLNEMLNKRKEETDQLHLSLEGLRKDQQNKKLQQEDSRKSVLRQQDLQISLENLQRDNLNLQQKVNALQIENTRKHRDLNKKNDEYLNIKRKYDETVQNLDRLERRQGEKIDQHRRT